MIFKCIFLFKSKIIKYIIKIMQYNLIIYPIDGYTINGYIVYRYTRIL